MVRGQRKKKKKNGGKKTRGDSLFPLCFFPRQFFARALIFRLPAHHPRPSERLEQPK